jgi:hypothetical protein
MWCYHGYSNRWIRFPKSTTAPPFLHHANIVYDIRGHKIIRTGGTTDWHDGQESSETWAFDLGTNSWTNLNPNPTFNPGYADWSGSMAGMSYDHLNGCAVAVSSDGATTVRLDLAANGWINPSPSGSPPGGGNMTGHFTYDKANNVHMLYTTGREIWSFKLGNGVAGRPLPPQNVTGTTDQNSITISWNAAGTGTAPESYRIYRALWGTSLPGPYAQIGTTTQTSYTDTPSVSSTASYSYFVTALAGSEESNASLPIFTYPVRPMGVAAEVVSANRVIVRWKDLALPDLSGYNIFRAKGGIPTSKSGFTKLNSSLLTRPVYVDSNIDLSDNIYRHYVVTAVNRLGQESGLSPLAHTIPDYPGGPWADLNADRMHWHPSVNGSIAGYHVYDNGFRINGTDPNPVPPKLTANPVTDTFYDYSTANSHGYAVAALNVLGQVGFHSDIIPIGGYPASDYYTEDGRNSPIPYDTFWTNIGDSIPLHSDKGISNNSELVVDVWPNPFNLRTTIVVNNGRRKTEDGKGRNIDLKVYNINGKMVDDLSPTIRNSFSWNAQHLPCGIYLLKARIGKNTVSKKLLLRK